MMIYAVKDHGNNCNELIIIPTNFVVRIFDRNFWLIVIVVSHLGCQALGAAPADLLAASIAARVILLHVPVSRYWFGLETGTSHVTDTDKRSID